MPPTATKVCIEHVSKVYFGDGSQRDVVAIDDLTIEVGGGEFISIIGPSGCGKSTLFNIIAGLLPPTRGRVLIDGREVRTKGHVGYMLQKDLLLPWRTVLENAVLGPEIQGVRRREAVERAVQLVPRFGLQGFEHHYPSSLSGGMRQRVALMRTFLYEKDVMLLDEPFGALDAQTRSQMQELLLNIWQDLRRTIMFVTHDIDEAIFLSDRVYILSARPGRLAMHLAVDLPRPRSYEVVATEGFVQLKRKALETLRRESLRAAP